MARGAWMEPKALLPAVADRRSVTSMRAFTQRWHPRGQGVLHDRGFCAIPNRPLPLRKRCRVAVENHRRRSRPGATRP